MACLNLLVVVPHRDNEIFGSGGTLLSFLARDEACDVVTLTLGEAERQICRRSPSKRSRALFGIPQSDERSLSAASHARNLPECSTGFPQELPPRDGQCQHRQRQQHPRHAGEFPGQRRSTQRRPSRDEAQQVAQAERSPVDAPDVVAAPPPVDHAQTEQAARG